MSGLFDAVYKPDVLTCLSDLSNDEVMTPPDIATRCWIYYLRKSGKIQKNKNIREIHDRETIIKNVYRVLLTRSRKGMFLYFPQDHKLDEIYQWFSNMLQITETH